MLSDFEPRETIVHRFKPVDRGPDARRCPDCINGELPNGSSSYKLEIDGTVEISSTPGSRCHTCRGEGWVKLVPAPPLVSEESGA